MLSVRAVCEQRHEHWASPCSWATQHSSQAATYTTTKIESGMAARQTSSQPQHTLARSLTQYSAGAKGNAIETQK